MSTIDTEKGAVEEQSYATIWIGGRYVELLDLRRAHESLMQRYVEVLGQTARLTQQTARAQLPGKWKWWRSSRIPLQASITRLFVWAHLRRTSSSLIAIYGQLHAALPPSGEPLGPASWMRAATDDLTRFRSAIPGAIARGAPPALLISALTLASKRMTVWVDIAFIYVVLFGGVFAVVATWGAFTLKRQIFLRTQRGTGQAGHDVDPSRSDLYELEGELFGLLDRPKRGERCWDAALIPLFVTAVTASYVTSGLIAVHKKEVARLSLSELLFLGGVLIVACGGGAYRYRKLRKRPR